MSKWLVTVETTTENQYIIHAVDEDEAIDKYHRGEWDEEEGEGILEEYVTRCIPIDSTNK